MGQYRAVPGVLVFATASLMEWNVPRERPSCEELCTVGLAAYHHSSTTTPTMSKRLNKRQQREAEELADLESQKIKWVETKEVEHDDSEELDERETGERVDSETDLPVAAKTGNLFATVRTPYPECPTERN